MNVVLQLLFFSVFAVASLFGAVDFTSQSVIDKRAVDSKNAYEYSKQCAAFYKIEEGKTYRDITQQLLDSPLTNDFIKSTIRQQHRRIVVFKYPSDGLYVKGYVSYVPDGKNNPLLVFLRGGNRLFGLMNPANIFSCTKNYSVIATTYRGSVNGGQDEFGGKDVNDVKNLVDFIPQLEKDLNITVSQAAKYVLGGSRGGMEMLLALQRFPHLQSYFEKAVALSAPTDLSVTISTRESMKRMFINDFGLVPGKNDQEWIDYRSPIKHCQTFQNDFPLLIIQGSADHRTHLDHGHLMVNELKRLGKNVTYMEIQGGMHCLKNHKDRMKIITNWLEKGDMKSSVGYYNNNATNFYNRTINADLSNLYHKFTAYLPKGAHILDAGCGVGRDAKYFQNQGYVVSAFDASEEMVRLASQELNTNVSLCCFQEMDFTNQFDGIWACASLLHVPYTELRSVMKKLHTALKPPGILYASFKYGTTKREADGRIFYDMDEQSILPYLEGLFEPIKVEQSYDPKSASPDKLWLNVLCKAK